MADGRWRISVTAPDWGQDHLSSEAIVAFVDGELAPGPHTRATEHLGECPECTVHVLAQAQARAALRTARCPSTPSALLSSLRSIPQDTELPPSPAGLAMTADGQLVAMVRPEPAATEAPGPARRSHPGQRRLRLGTGVAVSGLALGALAFGVPAGSDGPPSPVPVAGRGSPGGVVPIGSPGGMVDARFRLAPASTAASRPDARSTSMPHLR